MCLQINMVKYNANWEITNIYENLRIVWSQFCTDFLLFIYIRSTSNIYLFIGIQIRCQWIQTNSFLVTFGYTQYLVLHSMNDPEGRKTTIHCYLLSYRGTLIFIKSLFKFAQVGEQNQEIFVNYFICSHFTTGLQQLPWHLKIGVSIMIDYSETFL